MPFTPFHMGPGILIKSLLQGGFSLMVFAWSQIVMDIQPLIVLITGAGELHGFSHTYIGATLLAIFSALSGKYLAEIGLFILYINRQWRIKISWWVAFLSAFVGTYSHIILDSIMHSDMNPFFPFNTSNHLLGIISTTSLHAFCIYSAIIGSTIYFVIRGIRKLKQLNRRSGT